MTGGLRCRPSILPLFGPFVVTHRGSWVSAELRVLARELPPSLAEGDLGAGRPTNASSSARAGWSGRVQQSQG